MAGNKIEVWDPVVRIGHWTLVITFFTAYLTEHQFLTAHVWAGYVIGVVVCIRLVWGFVGTRHARFTDFVRAPAATFKYLSDLVRGHPQRYIGHNPAAGMMTVLLLICLAGTVISGIVLYGMEEFAGPIAVWVVDYSASEELWEGFHEVLTNLTLLLVGLHIAGMLWSSHAHRENLVEAMMTGRKKDLS
jgi:cytochrome b